MTLSLFHQDNADNRRVLRACSTLRAGFRPRPWARNPHTQLALMIGAEQRRAPLVWDRVETLEMTDGGVVSLSYCGVDASAATPVVILLPTITGDGDGLGDLVRLLRSALGWTVVVCNRRGHAGVPLATPRFNTMGNVADLRAQIARVQEDRPSAPLFAIGVSAGSGLLARYLGESPAAPIRAAAMHCPGYDLETLFDYAHPVYSRVMADRVKRHFLEPNAALFEGHPDYRWCAGARDLAQFHQRAHRLAGYATREQYLRASNPMEVAYDINVPLLVINAEDDPVCSVAMVEQVRRPLIAAIPQGILAVTRYGSHCAHLYGVRRRASWAHRVLVEFLAAHDA
ncbi:MAG: alpha/beta fold hydrolase [Sandaracinaceae bacterium]